MDFDGRTVSRFDLPAELASLGRDFGAKMFGGERAMDEAGTLLVGATRAGRREVWRRDPDGRWTMLDWFDENGPDVVGDDLVYFQGVDQYARNWRTGERRKIAWFDRSSGRRVEPNPADPALRHADAKPVAKAVATGETITITMGGKTTATIYPNLMVLDRR